MNKNNFAEKFNESSFNPVYLLMLAAFIMRLFTFMGISEGDDLSYTLLAHNFANGDFSAKFIFDIRWVVFVPVAVLYKIFGVNDITSIAPTMIYGVSSIWLAYKILLEETDKLTATVATLCYLSFPIVLIYGNFLQVAPSLEFFTLLTVYSFQQGQKSEKIQWFILGGFAIGAIFFARTTGLFIAPLASFYVWYKKGFNKKTVIWVACAAICSIIPPIIQGLVYLKVHGDFFHHVVISSKGVDYQNRMTDVDPKDLFFYIRTMFTEGNFANWKMFGFNGYLLVLALIGCISKAVMKKSGKEVLFLIWFLSYFCFMTFAPTSFSPYTTLIRNTRYAIIFLLPICAIYGILLRPLFKKSNKTAILASIIILVIIVSNFIFAMIDSQKFKERRRSQRASVEEILTNYPKEKIYLSDRNIGRRIAYYSGYTHKNYRNVKSLKQIKTSGIFLILNRMNLSPTRFSIPKEELKKIKKSPPKGMTFDKKTPFFTIYRVDADLLNSDD